MPTSSAALLTARTQQVGLRPVQPPARRSRSLRSVSVAVRQSVSLPTERSKKIEQALSDVENAVLNKRRPLPQIKKEEKTPGHKHTYQSTSPLKLTGPQVKHVDDRRISRDAIEKFVHSRRTSNDFSTAAGNINKEIEQQVSLTKRSNRRDTRSDNSDYINKHRRANNHTNERADDHTGQGNHVEGDDDDDVVVVDVSSSLKILRREQTVIQGAYASHLERKRALEQENASDVADAQRSYFVEVVSAINVIQGAYRRRLAYTRRYLYRDEKYDKAAIVIQSLFRGYRLRKLGRVVSLPVPDWATKNVFAAAACFHGTGILSFVFDDVKGSPIMLHVTCSSVKDAVHTRACVDNLVTAHELEEAEQNEHKQEQEQKQAQKEEERQEGEEQHNQHHQQQHQEQHHHQQQEINDENFLLKSSHTSLPVNDSTNDIPQSDSSAQQINDDTNDNINNDNESDDDAEDVAKENKDEDEDKGIARLAEIEPEINTDDDDEKMERLAEIEPEMNEHLNVDVAVAPVVSDALGEPPNQHNAPPPPPPQQQQQQHDNDDVDQAWSMYHVNKHHTVEEDVAMKPVEDLREIVPVTVAHTLQTSLQRNSEHNTQDGVVVLRVERVHTHNTQNTQMVVAMAEIIVDRVVREAINIVDKIRVTNAAEVVSTSNVQSVVKHEHGHTIIEPPDVVGDATNESSCHTDNTTDANTDNTTDNSTDNNTDINTGEGNDCNDTNTDNNTDEGNEGNDNNADTDDKTVHREDNTAITTKTTTNNNNTNNNNTDNNKTISVSVPSNDNNTTIDDTTTDAGDGDVVTPTPTALSSDLTNSSGVVSYIQQVSLDSDVSHMSLACDVEQEISSHGIDHVKQHASECLSQVQVQSVENVRQRGGEGAKDPSSTAAAHDVEGAKRRRGNDDNNNDDNAGDNEEQASRAHSRQDNKRARTQRIPSRTNVDQELLKKIVQLKHVVHAFPDNYVLEFFTDVEGNFAYLTKLVGGSKVVSWADDGSLELADNSFFVHGGDAVDKGPNDMRCLQLMLDLKIKYPDRVFLILGNRDINKMRFLSELENNTRFGATSVPYHLKCVKYKDFIKGNNYENDEVGALKWMLFETMGCRELFYLRKMELAELAGAEISSITDSQVAKSFKDLISPDGENPLYYQHLQLGQMMCQIGDLLFLHGGVNTEAIGFVPGLETRCATVAEWSSALNTWTEDQIAEFARQPTYNAQGKRGGDQLLDYGVPWYTGGAFNNLSLIYSNGFFNEGGPRVPEQQVQNFLNEGGVHRVLTGHKPQGDVPTVIKGDSLLIVIADTSYSDVSASKADNIANNRGDVFATVRVTSTTTSVSGVTANGSKHGFTIGVDLKDNYPTHAVGHKLANGSWVKSVLEGEGTKLYCIKHVGFGITRFYMTVEEMLAANPSFAKPSSSSLSSSLPPPSSTSSSSSSSLPPPSSSLSSSLPPPSLTSPSVPLPSSTSSSSSLLPPSSTSPSSSSRMVYQNESESILGGHGNNSKAEENFLEDGATAGNESLPEVEQSGVDVEK